MSDNPLFEPTYQSVDPRTHVYIKPGMYIGSDAFSLEPRWIYSFQEQRMVQAEVNFVPGLRHIFMEIITNASDNVGLSRRAGMDPGNIIVDITDSTVTIVNSGSPIKVEIDPTLGTWIPEAIFGRLLTGRNLEGDRHEAGTNGIGGKATNIFSKQFTVIICDAIRQLQYTQTWLENMTICQPPVIVPYNGKKSYVTVSYVADFARFGYPLPGTVSMDYQGTPYTGGYTSDLIQLLAKDSIDISFTTKVPVIFNKTEFSVHNIRDYARLYFGEAATNGLVHYQWPKDTQVVKSKAGQASKGWTIYPDVEMIVMDTPDAGVLLSFVNGLVTQSGIHVDSAFKAAGDSIVKTVNVESNKNLDKKNANKRSFSIDIRDVKPHVSMIVAIRVKNPEFQGQTKDHFLRPAPKIVIENTELQKLQSWNLVNRLYATLQAKQFMKLQREGKQRRFRSGKGTHANFAGKRGKENCMLIVTEGDSGAGYAETYMSYMAGNRDCLGLLPLRGKALNVMGMSLIQILQNAEIQELRRMLNATEELDYRIDANYLTLNYGAGLMIMADSDDDGAHIVCLLINIFNTLWPTLLVRGYLIDYCTRIVQVSKGNQVLNFYSSVEYEAWQKATPDHATWKVRYFKGLGSSSDELIKEDIQNPRTVGFVYDKHAQAYLQLAFDKKCAANRKQWMQAYVPRTTPPPYPYQNISWYIDNKLILYSLTNCKRSIPRFMDGFKDSLRKIIYTAHIKWKNVTTSFTKHKEYKVAQFEGAVAENTDYHHGEANLGNVIVRMAQDFVGMNNIPWFFPDGQFGTRYMGGANSAKTRYIHTYPEKLFGYILRSEDRPILEVASGEDAEPITYYPIVPMTLINGANGVASGYSTYIPNHNPLDIIDWYRVRLTGAKPIEPVPWYRGFTGDIAMIDRRMSVITDGSNHVVTANEPLDEYDTVLEGTDAEGNLIENLEIIDPDVDQTTVNEADNTKIQSSTLRTKPAVSFVSRGTFYCKDANTIVVTELPIGRWSDTYRKWLEHLEDTKQLKSFKNNSCKNVVNFELHGFVHPPTHKSLKLQRSMGMSNMTLLDNNNKPIKYATVGELLEAFYPERLAAYQRRKDANIRKLQADMQEIMYKIAYIKAVSVDKTLEIRDVAIQDVKYNMERMGLPFAIFKDIGNHQLTKEGFVKMNAKLVEIQKVIQAVSEEPLEVTWRRELDELEAAYIKVYGNHERGKRGVKFDRSHDDM